jgi:hypothetical protein
MQTVPFPCLHCGKLMAVAGEFLGAQVRCPHCQQVVVAPPAAAPADGLAPHAGSGETTVQPPTPADDPEDIFVPEETDDLFGRSESPRIEGPPDPLAPTLANGPSFPPPESAPNTMHASIAPYPLPDDAPPPPANGENTTTQPEAGQEDVPWMAGTLTEKPPASRAEAPAASGLDLAADGAPSASRPARRKGQGTPWFMILVFSPLVLYSIAVTIFAVMLYLYQRQIELDRRNPFEMMPDDGDNPGVQKGKKTTRQQYLYDPKLATLPLPDNLRTKLTPDGGKPLRIGELEITPTRVVRERVNVYVEDFQRPEPCTGDSLVLYLKMKNLSSDYAFAPLDNYFDRYWKPGMDLLPPLTQLEAGPDNRFYGGPAHWYPRGAANKQRQWIEGRKAFDAELLQPGAEEEFFVCTDGQDPRAELVLFGESEGEKVRAPYCGRFLWRIRVRRGLVRIKDKDYSATAVVGVEFTDRDIR